MALKERETTAERSVKNITVLRILVHPLFCVSFIDHSNVYPNFDEYERRRRELFETASTKFIPQSSNEVALIMHHLHDIKNFFYQREWLASRQDALGFIDLYRALKRNSTLPNNVMLAPNIVSKEGNVQELSARLKRKGYQITEGTKIIVGGEFLDLCVADAVRKMFALLQINEIRIDRSVSIHSGVRKGEKEGLLPLAGFKMTQEQEYYIFRRKES